VTQEQFQEICDEEGVSSEDDEVFTPWITLWAFLSQVMHKEELRSCLAAVSRIGVLLATGRPHCTHNSEPSAHFLRHPWSCSVIRGISSFS
jgi:hypothetical protein